ncbi:MAG TPA: M24 family metallopeptidase [Gemmatimonadales bacterium]|nr:M24 family metallopeptidase [Gemmatimonadales bacterium]
MSPLPLDPAALARALDAAGADAWLLYDFRGVNPVASRVLGLGGMGTRRLFVFLPKTGEPVAVAHKIELQPIEGFPGRIIPYARWQELHAALEPLVNGRTLAMEVSPEDAVPYLDRVPYGVVQLVEKLGGRVVPSAPLVSRFAAGWSAAETAGHRAAAEALADVARTELRRAVREAGTGLTESALQQRVVEAIHARGLEFDHPPIVAFGANAANPHYEPHPGRDATLEPNQVVLLDLWGGPALGTVFADQTWMGFSGPRSAVPPKVAEVWRTVRDAREAAARVVREGVAAGRPVAGWEGDRAARGVIEAAGYGDWFVHRTGHSIDRDLHGSGPHLDDYETHDDRALAPGVGFSIEPGIYLTGDFGVRSEVNMFWGPDGPEVTPREPQQELITAD